jgi:hypothetical protein
MAIITPQTFVNRFSAPSGPPAPGPASGEPVDGVTLSSQASPEQRQTQAAHQFVTGLSEQLGDGIEGWEQYHVEKMSFPFQVQKQADIAQDRANRIINRNQQHADRTLVRDSRLRNELRNALMDAGVSQPEIAAGDVKVMLDFFATRVQHKSNFYYSGTLCTVGWGSGDVEAARGYPPCGPKTVTKTLMSGAEEKALQVIKHYIP